MAKRLSNAKHWLKKHWRRLLVFLIVISLIYLAGYLQFFKGFSLPEWMGFSDYVGPDVASNRTFQRGKTLWDWMELLIIPMVLTGGAVYFNREERKVEREIASKRTQETALQIYFDRMTELILHEGLTKSKSSDVVRSVARARTLTILRTLDASQRGFVLQFLYESELVGANTIVKLEGAVLSEIWLASSTVDMSHVNLEGALVDHAMLSWANLSGANMRNAILSGARMNQTKLNGADLKGAHIWWASLVGADLTDADLTDALLDEANLRGAKITSEQLKTAKSLKGAILPDGTKHK